jgi:hydroxymethylbilane synthase
VPMELPAGFELVAILEREDPRDAFVSNLYANWAELPQGAVVGTSSLRRVVQLKALRPDLRIEPLRGNLDTRLRKLDEGGFDAIVLASAGLKRLGLAARIRCCFSVDEMIPCAGQGALGLEIRADAAALKAQLSGLIDRPTWLATQAERAVSRSLGGSCSMPLAAHASWVGAELQLAVALGDAEQAERPLLKASIQAEVADVEQALRFGERAAQALRDLGAAGYLPQS